MPLHDAVGINCKKGSLLKIKAQMSSIWAKACILGMTTPLWWRKKVIVYYYLINLFRSEFGAEEFIKPLVFRLRVLLELFIESDVHVWVVP